VVSAEKLAFAIPRTNFVSVSYMILRARNFMRSIMWSITWFPICTVLHSIKSVCYWLEIDSIFAFHYIKIYTICTIDAKC